MTTNPYYIFDNRPLIGSAKTYYLRFTDKSFVGVHGWAMVIICEVTGVVSMCTDWGNWSYRWATGKNLGNRTLEEFVVECGEDYLACKMLGGGSQEPDQHLTFVDAKESLIRDRRSGDLDKDEARAAWDELIDLGEEGFFNWLMHGYRNDDVDHLRDRFDHESIRSGPTGQYKALTEIIIPALRATLRVEIAKSKGTDSPWPMGVYPGHHKDCLARGLPVFVVGSLGEVSGPCGCRFHSFAEPGHAGRIVSPTGSICEVCKCPQYDSPNGGVVCKEGHGGAESITPEEAWGKR